MVAVLAEGVRWMISILNFQNLAQHIHSVEFQIGFIVGVNILGIVFSIATTPKASRRPKEIGYLERKGLRLFGRRYYDLRDVIYIVFIIIIIIIPSVIISITQPYPNKQFVDFLINYTLGIVSAIISGTIAGVAAVMICKKLRLI